MIETPVAEEAPVAETSLAEPAKPKRRSRKKADAEAEQAAPAPEPAAEAPADEKPAKPARKPRKKAVAAATDEAPSTASPVPTADNDAAANGEENDGEPRRGWWQRTFG